MDKDYLDYYLKELSNRKGTPYAMANEALADDFFSVCSSRVSGGNHGKAGNRPIHCSD